MKTMYAVIGNIGQEFGDIFSRHLTLSRAEDAFAKQQRWCEQQCKGGYFDGTIRIIPATLPADERIRYAEYPAPQPDSFSWSQ